MVSTLSLDNFVDFIEFVEINIHFQHTYFANLLVELESPSGKKSSLSVARNVYVANPVNGFFRFGSAAHLGENASGEWKLSVTDYVRGDSGTLHAWDIEVFVMASPLACRRYRPRRRDLRASTCLGEFRRR